MQAPLFFVLTLESVFWQFYHTQFLLSIHLHGKRFLKPYPTEELRFFYGGVVVY